MNRTSPYYCRRSVLSLLISALIYAPPGMTAFTPDVIGVVNDETVDGSQRVDERGTTNNTHIINHGQQNVHGGVSNGSLIESGGYQDVGSHNNFVGQANNTTINGGRQTIHDGGISTGTIIDSGNQDVYTGGISNGTTIKGGNSHCSGQVIFCPCLTTVLSASASQLICSFPGILLNDGLFLLPFCQAEGYISIPHPQHT